MPRKLLAMLGLLVLTALLVFAVVRVAGTRSTSPAAKVLGPLPAGYVYATMEEEDREATEALFREGYGAKDVAVALVGTPQDRAPVGVAVAVLVFADPPDTLDLARRLERDVTLVDPKPKSLAGEPVLGHEGDATFSSATLWVHGRLAVLTYGATTAEVDGVLEGLITAGAWRPVGGA